MAHWYYKGRTTTPINHPEHGSMVLKPRSRFEAPQSAVHHLVIAGLCVRIQDPKPEVHASARLEATEEVVAESVTKSEPEETAVDEDHPRPEPDPENAGYEAMVGEQIEHDIAEESEKDDPTPRRGKRSRRGRYEDREGS